MFVCKICSSEVRAGQAFCPTCGADVVENYETVCPVCGAKNVGGSRYCAKCGGILPVLRKPVCSVCGSKNLPGAMFCVSCGAPLAVEGETHSDGDILEARKAKMTVDAMQRDRMVAVERELAEKRARADEEREEAMREVENYRADCERDYQKRVQIVEEYKAKLEAFGSEDVELMKRMAFALREYAKYYADPYSQLDEDEIEGETYVCPACGTVNPLNVTACTNCGRNKARALLLLAKGKITRHPPVRRKRKIIEAPANDISGERMPTLEEFARSREQEEAPAPAEERREPPANFSGPSQAGGYFPPYGYPYPMQPYASPAAGYAPPFLMGADGKPYQMPPIVQPVAFVPYVTQEQPLMQYSPAEERRPAPATQPAAPVKPAEKKPQKGDKGDKATDRGDKV